LILAALDAAEAPNDVDIAGWRLHPLKGARRGEWSVGVSGNWRVTFRFDKNNVIDVNYEDYH
jgi:proteic killer suppression protein